MRQEDLEYLVSNLANLCGIPTRLYLNKKLVLFVSYVKFIIDPFVLYKNEVLPLKNHIGYFTTNDFFYYAYLNSDNYKIVIGPFRPIKPTLDVISKIALELELPKEQFSNFIYSMNSIITMPLESVLQSLTMFNFILNNEKKTLADILINIEQDNKINKIIQNEVSINQIDKINENYDNTSYLIEQELHSIVKNGELEKLKKWIKNAPATRSGLLSFDILRQTKNTFIVSTTIFSRAAIKGKMDIKEALSLSDLYIQKMELMNNIDDINNLQIKMLIDYTEHVAKIKGNDTYSPFLINLNKYIINHLSDAIKSENICSSLYISKSSLFCKIKKETGMTLSEYILKFKINESKNLLKYTNKPIPVISTYLGFSSQSHFNKVFKKYLNVTPLKYRNS